MEDKALENLIGKYLKGTASIDEIRKLDDWYNSFDSRSGLYLENTAELKQALTKGFSALKLRLLID